MAAAGLGNPVGAVVVADGGSPRIVSAKARNAIISGGVFVFASGAADVVSSGASSLIHGDILVTADASGGQFNGICMQTTEVSGACSVATQGLFILPTNGTIVAGATVMCDGNNAVLPGTTAGHVIGRAWTAAGSNTYAVIQLGL